MKAIREEKAEAPVQEEAPVAAALPSEETLRAQWKELAGQYSAKPRLANMLVSGKLDIREESGVMLLELFVTNESQKQWMEEKMLRELEGKIRTLVASPKVNLQVSVTPIEESAEKVPYMPEEKAKDLMEKNPDVRAFVADMGLDTK